MVLAPTLGYLYGDAQYSDESAELLEQPDSWPAAGESDGAADLGGARHDGGQALHTELALNNTDGFLTEPVLNQQLEEFDASKQRAVMNTTAGQAAEAASHSPDQGPANQGPAGGLAPAVDVLCTVGLSWSQDRMAARSSGTVGPRRFSPGSDGESARLAGDGGAAALGLWGLDKGGKTRVRFADISGANGRLKPVTDCVCLLMAEHGLPQIKVQDADAEETAAPDKAERLVLLLCPSGRYHWVGIDPDFQKFMQFDVPGTLYQCRALPFGWDDSPRVFVKFMKVPVECLRASEATRDRANIQQLRPMAVRQRAGGAGHTRAGAHGARVLPYTNDFLLLASSTEKVYELRQRLVHVSKAWSLRRNEEKGVWELVELMEHLGLEAALKEGELRAPHRRGATPRPWSSDQGDASLL
ncbi:hypothetical protein CYMTET_6511 [Cymbomonas tetramitiformis]|uniref:Uncharacterized protein n=1 Tax=Cymbomonas tetramitiformis TaxID=36881 RepID=A0AAE0GX30_9CHLO|nr:hypothetical protein CYMTET_6511 [Cymbomonas tetramitiformis]